jgi:hypothetical protein
MIKIDYKKINSNSLKPNNVFVGGVGAIKIEAQPYVGGYSFLKITRLPTDPTLAGDIINSDFCDLLERTFKSVSGINDIEIDSSSIQGGFTSNEHFFPTSSQKSTNEITLQFQELTGNVYQGPFQAWTSGIRDPETNLYTLDDYSLQAYTIEMLYINCNPSIGSKNPENRAKAVEFAAYFTSGWPTKNPLSHFNFQQGSHEFVEIEIPFKVNPIYGVDVINKAKEYVKTDKFYNDMIKKAKYYDSLLSGSKNSRLNDINSPNNQTIGSEWN